MGGQGRGNGERSARNAQGAPRRGARGVGAGVAVGTFVTLGLTPVATAPDAHADFDDLIVDPIVQAIDQVLDWGPSDPGLDLDGDVAPALSAGDTGSAQLDNLDNTVPLEMEVNTEPVVDLAINGDEDIPVVVDTGSNGLVVPFSDINWWDDPTLPTGFGFGEYSGGLEYFYLQFPATVAFENGPTTAEPTEVDAVLFSWPASFQSSWWSFEGFMDAAHAEGVLGIAPDAVGPDHDDAAVIAELPGELSQGVLFKEEAGQLVFGPDPLTGGTTVDGVADATLKVQVNGGDIVPVDTIIDSGGVYGTIPDYMMGKGVDVGEHLSGANISVYTESGDPLYSYTAGSGTHSPVVVSGATMNTGYKPFDLGPVYIDVDGGSGATTTFHFQP